MNGRWTRRDSEQPTIIKLSSPLSLVGSDLFLSFSNTRRRIGGCCCLLLEMPSVSQRRSECERRMRMRIRTRMRTRTSNSSRASAHDVMMIKFFRTEKASLSLFVCLRFANCIRFSLSAASSPVLQCERKRTKANANEKRIETKRAEIPHRTSSNKRREQQERSCTEKKEHKKVAPSKCRRPKPNCAGQAHTQSRRHSSALLMRGGSGIGSNRAASSLLCCASSWSPPTPTPLTQPASRSASQPTMTTRFNGESVHMCSARSSGCICFGCDFSSAQQEQRDAAYNTGLLRPLLLLLLRSFFEADKPL